MLYIISRHVKDVSWTHLVHVHVSKKEQPFLDEDATNTWENEGK